MSNAEQIVARQRAYFATGESLPTSFRRQALDALRASILRHENDINDALMQDLGKSPSETYMCETGVRCSAALRMTSRPTFTPPVKKM